MLCSGLVERPGADRVTMPSMNPLHDEFGVRITGIDLSRPLSDPVLEHVREAIDRHSFLVFPDQQLDDERHLALTRQLGEPEANHARLGRDGVVDYFGTIGNVQSDNTVVGNDHPQTRFLRGNDMWHSDSSFRAVPSMVSIMYACEVPAEGGHTEFASTRSAYRRLPAAMRKIIDPLIVVHDYVFSRSKVAAVTPRHAASLPPVSHRLVRSNPRTGERNFFVGSHARNILGWNDAESRELLDDLLDRATGPGHRITHRWKPGDLVIWDNRCLLHRGTGYDADRYRRRMRQTRVAGTEPALQESNPTCRSNRHD